MAQEENLAERLFGNQQQSMGGMEALTTGLKEGIKSLADGVGKAFDLVQSSPALNHAATMGTHELAAALFNGSGFVMYPRTGGKEDPAQEKDGPEQGQQQHEQEHERGRSM
jgi:hypothetical protein